MQSFFIGQLFGHNGYGRKTETAGTTIELLVPGVQGARTVIVALKHTDAGTAHLSTAIRELGRTTAAAAAASGQADVVLTADPSPSGNTIGNGDWVVIHHSADGVHRQYKLHASAAWNSTTKTMTLVGNLSVAVAAGDSVWFMGIATDTDPNTGIAHPRFQSNQALEGAIAASIKEYSPILVQTDNATSAGTTNYLQYAYSKGSK